MKNGYHTYTKFYTTVIASFLILTGGFTDLSAQITITSSNLQQSLESEFSATQSLSTDTENLLDLVELSGAEQVWDFTSITFEENFSGTYSTLDNPADAPEGDDPHFAQATHVTTMQLEHAETIEDEEIEIFLDVYGFAILDEDELVSLGGVFMEGVRDSGEVEDSVLIVYSIPGNIEYQFPLTYEDTWEFQYETVFGSDTSGSSTEFDVLVEVDGWGEVITEEGSEDVLRIRRTETMTIGGFDFVSYEYSFVNQAGLEVAAISGYNDTFDPESEELSASNISYSTSTSVEDPGNLPNELVLKQNYPNPFNPSTEIRYQLPENSLVNLEVYDMLGRKVETLIDGEQKSAGNYSATFDASSLSSGTYIYRLSADGQVLTKKLMLIK